MTRVLNSRPEEILSRIASGDPLGLQLVCMRFLRENGLILDPDRVLEYSLDEVAFMAARAEPEELDGYWLEDRVENACQRLLGEDLEDERLASQGIRVDDRKHQFVCLAFAINPDGGRRASVRFHGLPLRARRAFLCVCVDKVPVMEWLENTGCTKEDLSDDIWDVFCAFGQVTPEEVAAFREHVKKEKKR